MTTKELIDYVEGELKKGEQKDAIKARLLQNGWSGDDIEETFRIVERRIASAESVFSIRAYNPTTTPQHNSGEILKTKNKLPMILSAIGIFIGFNIFSWLLLIWPVTHNLSLFSYNPLHESGILAGVFLVAIIAFPLSLITTISFVFRQKKLVISLITLFVISIIILWGGEYLHYRNKVKIENYLSQVECENKSNCVSELAISLNKPYLCNYTEWDRPNCYIKLAVIKNDTSICENIFWSLDEENICKSRMMLDRANIESNVNLCENIKKLVRGDGGDRLYNCYQGVAVKTLNLDLCDKITSQNYNGRCKFNVRVANAIAENNITICRDLEKDLERENFQKSMQEKNPDYQYVSYDNVIKCYQGIAEKTLDLNPCNEIKNEVERRSAIGVTRSSYDHIKKECRTKVLELQKK